MRFVIIGAGRVGLRTARVLRDEDHEVTVVERDEPTLRRARDQGFPPSRATALARISSRRPVSRRPTPSVR